MVTCLVPLLEKCMQLSLKMQTVNTIPWELMEEQNSFLSDMRAMRDALRAEEGFSEHYYPFLYRPVYGNTVGDVNRYVDFLRTGELLGQGLLIHCETFPADNPANDQAQAYRELQHVMADWIENIVHFFEVRFIDDEHGMLAVAAKCLDLRLYCRKSFPNNQGISRYLDESVKPIFQQVWDWAKSAGVNVAPWATAWAALQVLAKRLHSDVVDFYAGATNENSRHKWHDNNCDVNVSGTKIQKDVLTAERFYIGAEAALHIYCMTILKTANEAVVEGMCGFVDKHAEGQRGLSFVMYAYEAIVHFNMPAQNKCSLFIKDALRLYGEATQHNGVVRFVSTDLKQRTLTTFVSKVIDRIRAQESKLSFM